MATNRILTALTVLLAWFPLGAAAADVRLAWDPSPDAGVTNYVIYAGTNSFTTANLGTAVVRQNAGTNLMATVHNIRSGVTWYFVATAEMSGIESDLSNEIIRRQPGPPLNLSTVTGNLTINININLPDVLANLSKPADK